MAKEIKAGFKAVIGEEEIKVSALRPAYGATEVPRMRKWWYMGLLLRD